MTAQTGTNRNNSSLLNRTFAINWEIVVYALILLTALFTRFYVLGDRVMSHDESLHTRYSYNLYNEGDFSHTPLMHGPILFHATAFFYSLFGDSDYSARIYTSIVGVMLVMSPLLFRRWLGRWGAILASLMLLVSPLTMYYGRYIRHDMPSIVSALLMIWAMMMYLDGPARQQRRTYWLVLVAIGMIWNLGSKETAFIYIAIIGIFLLVYFFFRLFQYFAKKPARPVFYLGMVGFLLGGVMSLAMYIIVDIIQFDLFGGPNRTRFSMLPQADQATFFLWSFIAISIVIAIAIATLVWAYRDDIRRIPWGEVAVVIGIALATCTLLVVFEELSYTTPSSATQPISPAVPGEGEGAAHTSAISWAPMIGLWVVAIGGFLFLFLTRRRPDYDANRESSDLRTGKDKLGRGFWGTLDLFPEVDLLVVIGTLILPWSTAFIPYLMGGTPQDLQAVANSLPQPIFNFINVYIPAIAGPTQIGNVLLHFIAWLPLMVLSITIGIMWDWKRWLVPFIVFHLIFAFFFTTIFTNVNGFATGMIHSLGYWLEQQGERRGSQPQYYYLLIIMPYYEFLPVIGSVTAMFGGLTMFWRGRRRARAMSQELRRAENYIARKHTLAVEQLPINTTSVDAVVESADSPDPDTPEPAGVMNAADSTQTEPALSDYGEVDPTQDAGNMPATVNATPTSVDGLISPQKQDDLFGRADASVGESEAEDEERETSEAEDDTSPGMADYNEKVTTQDVRRFQVRDEERESPVDASSRIEDVEIIEAAYTEADVQALRQQRESLRLDGIPFLVFFSWLAILNLVGYSLAGEKMPWLGTHLTMPLIFLTGWFFGRIVERLDRDKLRSSGWIAAIVMIVFGVGFFRTLQPLLMGVRPFSGTSEAALQVTYSWIVSVIVTGAAGSYLVTLSERLGWLQLRRLMAVVIFGGLSVVTFRSAWIASFINYDYPTEFLVYAHAAPGVKWVMDDIEELSLRITDGYDLPVAYDNEVSWPMSWYFRNYTDALYVGADPNVSNLDGRIAVVVGPNNYAKVEPILEETYIRMDHMRLWWPMQEYFYLNPNRVENFFSLDPSNEEAPMLRQGVFDIWWSRDYSTYGAATGKNFDITSWPVSEEMRLYVRRDYAAQIWEYGLGEGTVENPLDTIEVSQCTANWQNLVADQVLTAPDGLTNPIGISIDDDGTVYVAEEFAHRVSVFDEDGNYVESFGEQGGGGFGDGIEFERPNSVSVGPDGNLFVVDTWNYRIQVFDEDRDFVTELGRAGTFGSSAPTDPTDAFWGPRDIYVDENGLVYISDTGNKRIRVYEFTGEALRFLRDIGEGGSALGQLEEPTGVVVGADGRVYIAEPWNRRVSIFDQDGNFLDAFPVRGLYGENAGYPYLAIDEERELLYMTDPNSGRVLVHNLEGDCVGAFGQAASSNPTRSQLGVASGIAIGNDGHVYVVDNRFGRVLRFPPFDFIPEDMRDDADVNVEGVDSEDTSADEDASVFSLENAGSFDGFTFGNPDDDDDTTDE